MEKKIQIVTTKLNLSFETVKRSHKIPEQQNWVDLGKVLVVIVMQEYIPYLKILQNKKKKKNSSSLGKINKKWFDIQDKGKSII